MRHIYIVPLLYLAISPYILAGELVYRPMNPSFGGNPLNGSYLLNNAQAQNTTKDPDATTRTIRSDLDRFTDSLQSRLLSQLLADVGTGNTGSLVTDDYSINIIDDGSGGLEVQITDLNTSESTIISVNGLIPD